LIYFVGNLIFFIYFSTACWSSQDNRQATEGHNQIIF